MIKRTADFEVNHGTDINSIDKLMTVLQARTNIIVIRINETDVEQRAKMIPNNLETFMGTLKVHQVLWERNCRRLNFRTSSCFKCTTMQICTHGKHLGFGLRLQCN